MSYPAGAVSSGRARVLAAISHREADRVPVDLGSTPSSGISAIAYTRTAAFLGAADLRPKVYDVVQELAQPEDWMLDRFHVDVVDVGRVWNDKPGDWRETAMPGGWTYLYPAWFKPQRRGDAFFVHDAEGTLIAQRPDGATFYDERCFPWEDGYPADFSGLGAAMGKVLWSALVHSPWDHAGEADFWKKLRERSLELRATTDRALMIVVGCNLFEWGTFLRRIDNFLMDLYIDESNVERLLDALMEVHLSNLEKVCAAVGDIVDVVRFGDDLGHEGGPFMSPEIYRRLFKPRHRQLNEFVKSHSGMKTFLHSCGSIYELLPDLIEAGYDVINPVQTSARGMAPEVLKREFGKDITFWGGGIDNRAVLNKASPSEVKAEAKRRLDILAPGGGFVFNTVHNILPDVPPENIVALFDGVAEWNEGR
jgi:uroporphyrinogen decarboxylase